MTAWGRLIRVPLIADDVRQAREWAARFVAIAGPPRRIQTAAERFSGVVSGKLAEVGWGRHFRHPVGWELSPEQREDGGDFHLSDGSIVAVKSVHVHTNMSHDYRILYGAVEEDRWPAYLSLALVELTFRYVGIAGWIGKEDYWSKMRRADDLAATSRSTPLGVLRSELNEVYTGDFFGPLPVWVAPAAEGPTLAPLPKLFRQGALFDRF